MCDRLIHSAKKLVDQLVSLKSYSEETVGEVMSQLLSAMNHCHVRRILHRDLRLGSLLCEPTDKGFKLRLTDFGMGELFSPAGELLKQAAEEATVFTAPEALDKRYNEKSDIWSCGIIMYTLLCGCPPFRAAAQGELIENIRKGKFSFKVREEVSKDAKDLLEHMLMPLSYKRANAVSSYTHHWIQSKSYPPENTELSANIRKGLLRFVVTIFRHRIGSRRAEGDRTDLSGDRGI